MSLRTAMSNAIWWMCKPALAHCFSITSHLTCRERIELFELARRPGIRTIVEIGSYLGASAVAFGAGLHSAANASARVYCVDTWNNDAMTEGQRETMGEFLANTAHYRDRIVPVRGWSTAVARDIGRQIEQVDILFIDGDHSYEGCLADWDAYKHLLAPRATVVFHDIGWAEGVQRVVREQVAPRVGREKSLPNLWWGELA